METKVTREDLRNMAIGEIRTFLLSNAQMCLFIS